MAQNALLDFLQGASNAAASNVSAPVDGIAWLLRKAGIDVGDTPMGGSDWMRANGLTAEPQNKLAGVLGESFGSVAPIFAAAKAPQIAQGLLKAGDNLAAPRTLSSQAGVAGPGSRPKYLELLVDVLKSGQATDVAFGAVSPRNEKNVNALREVLGQPMVKKGDQWVIPKNVAQKLIDKRVVNEGMSAEKLADTLNSAVHSTRNRVFQSEHPQIQGMLTTKSKTSNVGFVGVNPKTGEPVIKSGYPIATKRGNDVMNEGRGLLSSGGTQSTIVTTPKGDATGAYLPGYAESLNNVAQPSYSPQYQAALDAGLDMSFEARMQRAAEQGYTMPVYHGSNSGDIAAFDPEKFRKTVQYMPGVFTADSPDLASNFGDVIYPLLQRQGVSVLEKVKAARAGLPAPVVDSIHDKVAGIHVTSDPSNIRSINAAFNPANIGKADLLGRINPQLLPWLAGGGLVSQAVMNRDK